MDKHKKYELVSQENNENGKQNNLPNKILNIKIHCKPRLFPIKLTSDHYSFMFSKKKLPSLTALVVCTI